MELVFGENCLLTGILFFLTGLHSYPPPRRGCPCLRPQVRLPDQCLVSTWNFRVDAPGTNGLDYAVLGLLFWLLAANCFTWSNAVCEAGHGSVGHCASHTECRLSNPAMGLHPN